MYLSLRHYTDVSWDAYTSEIFSGSVMKGGIFQVYFMEEKYTIIMLLKKLEALI